MLRILSVNIAQLDIREEMGQAHLEFLWNPERISPSFMTGSRNLPLTQCLINMINYVGKFL